MGVFPAMPLARMVTMSLVEVSPSMEIMLNVSAMSCDSAVCNMAGEISTSVVRKTSMVAILGWIIPEPFAMPPM